MTEALVLDLVLGISLIAYVIWGFRHGLSSAIFAIAGIVLGLIAAFFVTPLVASWVPVPLLRIIVTIFVGLGLIAAGHALGGAVGRGIRRGIERGPLSGIDRVLGAVVSGIVAALVMSVIATSIAQLGVPALSRAIGGSTVLRVINTVTPDPVEAWLAQARAAIADRGMQTFGEAIGTTPPVPTIDAGTPALTAAAQSVVRITGNAYACGQSQAGSGFVISDDRVLTNAHVVAGVTEPVIEAPDGETITGTIVYFDPTIDLAVIAAPGLNAVPLPLGDTLITGSDAAVEGYPYGGPFMASGASVVSVGTVSVPDIYGSTTAEREVYTLAAQVREGNSGGPLLATDGSVSGIVFARNASEDSVGYAMTMEEIDPVAAQAPTLAAAVDSGTCISGSR